MKMHKDYFDRLEQLRSGLDDLRKGLRSEVSTIAKELDVTVRKNIEASIEASDVYRDKCSLASIEIARKLTVAAELKDEATGAHIQRLGLYCKRIAEELGMPKEFIDHIYHSSPLHDIGKIGIPDNILLKKGKLTSQEMDIAKTHTLLGYAILKNSEFPMIQMSASISLTHHERYDGTGYPRKLKGEDIPIEGRIAMMADQYDSLRAIRPYKKGLVHVDTYDIITKGDERTSPAYFDPEIFNIFIKIHKDFDEIFNTHTTTVEWINS